MCAIIPALYRAILLLTRSTTGIVVVDDSDTSSISYDGSWYTSNNAEVFGGTGHKTHAAGSTARFTFTGTSVAVYGTISGAPSGPPNATFALDDCTPITFSPPVVAATDLHQQLFYQSPALSDSEHQLVVTHNDNNSPLWLDYFLYLPSSQSPLELLPPFPPSTVLKIRDPDRLTPDTQKPEPSSSPSAPASEPQKRSYKKLWIILGCTFAVLLVLLIILMAYFKLSDNGAECYGCCCGCIAAGETILYMALAG